MCPLHWKDLVKLFGRYLIAFSITSKHYLQKKTYTRTKRCPELEEILPKTHLNRIYKVANRYRPLACLYAAQRIVEIAIKERLFTRAIARDLNPRFVGWQTSWGLVSVFCTHPYLGFIHYIYGR